MNPVVLVRNYWRTAAFLAAAAVVELLLVMRP